MNESSNPFQPPETPIGPQVMPATYSRWSSLRWFPAAVCFAMSLFGFLLGLGLFGWISWIMIRRGWSYFELMFDNPILGIIELPAACLFFGVGGLVGYQAARAWMRRRWKMAILLTILIYPTMLPGGFLIDPSRHRDSRGKSSASLLLKTFRTDQT